MPDQRTAWTLILVLLACSGTSRRAGNTLPDWLETGQSKEYPREEYLVGIGRGRSMQAAEDNARAEIAKIFEVSVGQVTKERTRYREDEASLGSSEWSRTLEISQATEVETSKVLSGVEIVARYEGPDGFAAMAVLSRREASERLWRRARALAGRVEVLIAKARAADDPLEAARAYYQSAMLLEVIEALNKDILILGRRKPVEVQVSSGEAWDAFRSTVRNALPFSVVVEGDQSQRIREAIESGLSERGVPLSGTGKAQRILVRGHFALTTEERNQKDFTFVRYKLAMEAVDTKDGTVWASFGPISDTASGKTHAQAVERALWLVTSRHLVIFIDNLFERLFGAGLEKEME